MPLYDLSPPVGPCTAVWPGDTPFSMTPLLSLQQGDSVNLSRVELSLHTGAHADAPLHFLQEGAGIGEVGLEAYVGPALLLRLEGAGEEIHSRDLEPWLDPMPRRLLVAANPHLCFEQFPERFAYFSAEAARYLGERGLLLIGTDAPSVDRVDSKELPAHRTFGRYGVAILENLNLRQVPPGEYELIALPLRILGGDASPVRAVLRTIP